MHRSVVLFLLFLFSVNVYCRRDLEQLRINWSERDGFSLISDLLDITVNDSDVSIDSNIGTLHVEDGDVVIDSQILKLDTRQEIIVEVDNGKVLKLQSGETGDVELSIGEEEELAKILIRPREDTAVEGEAVLVDFSKDGDIVTVAVGENGEIVDVVVSEDAVRVSQDKAIAKVNLSTKEVDLEINDSDRERIQEKRRQNANSAKSDGLSYIQVSGSSIVSSSSQARY